MYFSKVNVRYSKADCPFAAKHINSGESLFLRKLLWASLPNKRQKSRDRSCLRLPQPSCFICWIPSKGISNIILAMTRRDVGKPAFSLRKRRSVKTHALSLLGTTRLLSRSECLAALGSNTWFCPLSALIAITTLKLLP